MYGKNGVSGVGGHGLPFMGVLWQLQVPLKSIIFIKKVKI